MKQDAFHPGMRYLYEKYSPGYIGIPRRNGMKKFWVYVNVITNL